MADNINTQGQVPQADVIKTTVSKIASARSDSFFSGNPSPKDTISTSVKK